MLKKLLATSVAVLSMSVAAQAATYAISFSGASGSSMTGTLEFDDSLMGTGVIDETDIDELSIEVFLNGVSQGSRSLIGDGLGSTASTFNLNFDTDIGQFVVGGFSAGATGQDWFTDVGGNGCDTVGFSSGSGAQGVCVNGSFIFGVSIGSPTLSASLVSDVPLPASGAFLLAAIGVGGWPSRRRKAA